MTIEGEWNAKRQRFSKRIYVPDDRVFVLCELCPAAMTEGAAEEHLERPGRHFLTKIDSYSGQASTWTRETARFGPRDKMRNPNRKYII